MGIVSIECKTPKPGPEAAGRRCAHPGCITVLNRYHSGAHCYAHDGSELGLPPAQLEDLISQPPLRRAA